MLKFISAICACLTISLSTIAADYGNTQKTNPMRGKVLAKEISVYSSASSSSSVASFSPIKQGDFVYFDVRDRIIRDGVEWLSFKHTDGNTYYVYAQLLTLVDNPKYGASPSRTPSDVASPKSSTISSKDEVSQVSNSTKVKSSTTTSKTPQKQTQSTTNSKNVNSDKPKKKIAVPEPKEEQISSEPVNTKSEKSANSSNTKVKWGIVSALGVLVALLIASLFFLFKKLREL